MNTFFRGLLVSTLLTLIVVSCKKYDEGPAISFLSKKSRVANTWVFESYTIDGVDSTAFYAAPGTELTLDKDYNASGMIVQSDGTNFDTTVFSGTWEFVEKNKGFGMILTDAETMIIDTNYWWIRKLKSKEFWLEEDDNGQTGVEYFKLKPKE
ncbi:hypothetical protein JYT72_01855 [Crocinitomix catalasitica]|nr:hypothetical protein [Crocinitomix catalasitica]